MLFSIIVPVYNVEKYIEKCITSIQNSKFDDYEIILVDDGSTDNSAFICDQLKSTKVNVIHKINGGLSDARNVGINSSKGDYILFVDSDDFINPDALTDIKESIVNRNFPDIVCLECSKFYEDSNRLVNLNDGITSLIDDLSGDDLYNYFANLNKFPASACTKAINRRFLLDKSLFFKKGRLSEDYEWSIRLFSCISTAAYCATEYYYYRQAREGSITTSAGYKNMLHIFETVKEGCDLAKTEQNPCKKRMIYSFIEYIFRFLIMGYDYVDDKYRNSYKKELQKYSFILGTRRDKASVLIQYTYKILGVSLSNKVLRFYINHRV